MPGLHAYHTPAYVSIRQHMSAYVGIRQHSSAYVSIRSLLGSMSIASDQRSIRQHTSAYCQHTSAYVSIRQHSSAYENKRLPGLHEYGLGPEEAAIGAFLQRLYTAYVSTRQHTPAYVSIRQHTSAYVSIRQHARQHTCLREARGGELFVFR